MSIFSKVWKAAKKVAPVVIGGALGSVVPGIGTALGASIGGGLGSAARGGDLGQILQGAGYGYGAGSVAGGLAGALGSVGKPLVGPTISGAPLSGTLGIGGALRAAGTGAISNATSGLSSLFNGGVGGATSGLSSLLNSPSTLLGAAGNAYSGIQGNSAIKKMTAAQTKANQDALALQARMYDQTSANMSPFLAAGTSANRRLSDLLGTSENAGASGFGSLTTPFNMSSFQADPGYQFRLAEGTKAMNQSLGARGSLFSGDALKAAQSFGQGLADQTYQDAYNRYNADQANQYNMLNTQAQAGQNAAGNLGATGSNYANAAGGLMSNQGNITASGIQAGQNVTNQSLANLLGSNVGGFTSNQGLSPDQLIQLKRQLGMV